MSMYYIYQDQKRCIGCYACEVHCKTKNKLPVGPRFSRIMPVGPQMVSGIPKIQFIFMPCFHCEKPWCVSACPTGAMKKRVEDGIVFVESALCVGCKSCITACPWGVPQWNPEQGKVLKCDYCKDRIDKGLKPACVTKCTAHALKWLSPEEVSTLKRERSAQGLANQGSL
jgi:Fe-S-cluster-containing dehydrogenase component